MKTFQMRKKIKVETNEIDASRLCPKSVTGVKTFRMRMKKKVKTIENQRVSDLSKKRHSNEKTFQMRMKIKLKTREISLIFTFI